MNKNILFTINLIAFNLLGGLYAVKVNSQTVSTYFTSGTSLCDPYPYKLIFYDNFSGYNDNTGLYPGVFHSNVLNPQRWKTYFPSWATEDDGGIGHIGENGRYNNYSDANVVLSDGNCNLIATYSPNSVEGHSCNVLTGMLFQRRHFSISYGKYEARIKMPIFYYAHSTFWVMQQSQTGEIDFSEGYGDPLSAFFDNYRRTTFGQHQFFFPSGSPVGTTPTDYTGWWKWPHQTWWDIVTHHYFNENDWHIYTCEWDPNFIRYYLDGILIKTVNKYIASCTVPTTGTYVSNSQFPPDGTQADLEFTLDVDRPLWRPPGFYGELGRMIIDYVKVYQGHPVSEIPVFPDLCDRHIEGPTYMCDGSKYTYTLVGAGSTLPGVLPHWSVSSNLTIVSQDWTSVTVVKSGGSATGWVKFTDDNPDCGIITFDITTGGPTPAFLEVSTAPCDETVTFFVDWGTTEILSYEWSVGGAGSSYPLTIHHNIPSFGFTAVGFPFTVPWGLSATNKCGTSSRGNLAHSFCGHHPARTESLDSCIDFNLSKEFENEEIIFYPNPVDKVVILDLSNATFSFGDELLIAVYDVFGKRKVLYEDKLKNNTMEVDLTQLSNGIYGAEIYINSKIIKKFKFEKK